MLSGGAAALVVLLYHLRAIYIVPIGDARGGFGRVIYADYYFAAAVMLFFGLSGYLVGGSTLKVLSRGSFSWRGYLASRCSRLYMVLIPALILTVVADQLVVAYAGPSGAFWGPTDTIRNFFGNLFFLQHVLVAPFGSNGPLWSLSYEFWYYLVFPLCATLGYRATRYPWFSAAAVLLIGWIVREQILALFPCWLMGVLLGDLAKRLPVPQSLVRRILALASITAVFACVAAQALKMVTNQNLMYWMDSLALAPLLYVAIISPPFRSSLYARFSVFFSEISYTLYLTHTSILILLNVFVFRSVKWQPNAAGLALLSLPMTGAILMAWILYLAFEARTGKLRAVLLRLSPPLPAMARRERR